MRVVYYSGVGSKVVRADFGSGLICLRAQTCMDSKVVRADFSSGLICPRAQTCMDSKVVRADFSNGLICPRAQTCCAELRRLARLANSPGFKSFRCSRWRIKFSLERFSDPSRIRLRAQPLKISARRVPQAADGTCNNVGESNSRTNVFQIRRASVCVLSR